MTNFSGLRVRECLQAGCLVFTTASAVRTLNRLSAKCRAQDRHVVLCQKKYDLVLNDKSQLLSPALCRCWFGDQTGIQSSP